MRAQFTNVEQTCVSVSLDAEEMLGGIGGPAEFLLTLPSPGNKEHDALMSLVASGSLAIEAFTPPLQAVPDAISDRQFAQVLAIDGLITEPEALAWAARGDLPAALEEAISAMPDDKGQQFSARMLLGAATTYQRRHPLVAALGAILGRDAAALDSIWTRGALL